MSRPRISGEDPSREAAAWESPARECPVIWENAHQSRRDETDDSQITEIFGSLVTSITCEISKTVYPFPHTDSGIGNPKRFHCGTH